MAFCNQALEASPADVAKAPGEKPVEAVARIFGRDGGGELIGGWHMARSAADPGTGAVSLQPGAEQEAPNVRVLRIVVIVLGVMLALCFVTVFGVIAYRLANPRPAAAEHGDYAAALPAGSRIVSVDVEGDRLAIHVASGEASEILLIDARRGRLLGKVRLGPGVAASD